MSKNDFFIAGRWRNRDNIQVVLDAVRTSGRSAYCFIENAYKTEDFEVGAKGVDPDDFMTKTEALRQDDPLMREIFEVDMAGRTRSRCLSACIAGWYCGAHRIGGGLRAREEVL